MKRSGSNKRKRRHQHSIRFDDAEELTVQARAERAGLPVAAMIRNVIIEEPEPRAVRRPTVNHRQVCQLLGTLGAISESLRKAASSGLIDLKNPYISAALRDLSEMRSVCIQAMGRK